MAADQRHATARAHRFLQHPGLDASHRQLGRYPERWLSGIQRRRYWRAGCWRAGYWRACSWLACCWLVCCWLIGLMAPGALSSWARADEPVLSGPQVGEPLPEFKVLLALGEKAGEEADFVRQAAGKPIVLIFVHDLNRQSISMTRILSQYSLSRAPDGLATGVVWLDDDVTAAENTLKRIQHALTPGAPTGISVDGREGPGSYGLNRNVMLTILVANQGRVTANYALIQPSLQVDLPKILQSIVELVGGEVPALQELPGMPATLMRNAESGDQSKDNKNAGTRSENSEAPNLRPVLAPVIRLSATDEEVDRAAQEAEEFVANNPAAQRELGRIAKTIVSSGKLTNYGTERAQHHLQLWSEKYGPLADTPAEPVSPPTKPR